MTFKATPLNLWDSVSHTDILQISSSPCLPQGCGTSYFLCLDLHILNVIPSERHSMMTQSKLAIQSLSIFCIILLEFFYIALITIWYYPVFLFVHHLTPSPGISVPYPFCAALEHYLVHSKFSMNMCWVNKWMDEQPYELRTLYLRGEEYFIIHEETKL